MRVILYIKIIVFIIGTVFVSSCTPKVPYEIKSPCVSIDNSNSPYAISPCIRKPINTNGTIS